MVPASDDPLAICGDRQWRQVAKLAKKIFIAFLDELGNFEHFETYFFFRQFGDLATASGAN